MYITTAVILAVIGIILLANISNGVAAATGLVVAVLVAIIILKRNN